MLVRQFGLCLLLTFFYSLNGQKGLEYDFNKNPEIGLGYNLNSFKGELQNNSLINSPLRSNDGYYFFIRKPLSPLIGFNFNVNFGNQFLVDNGTPSFENFNVQTKWMSQQLQLSLNIASIYNSTNAKPFITPYLHFGLGLFYFNSFGDVYNADGLRYHYWSDGTIRSLSESSPLSSSAILLERDHVYETSLRTLNNDGYGMYPQLTMSVPLGVSLKFKAYKGWHVSLENGLQMIQSDLVDDLSPAGEGSRLGNEKKDQLWTTRVTISYDFGLKDASEKNTDEDKIARKEAKKALKAQKKAERLAQKNAEKAAKELTSQKEEPKSNEVTVPENETEEEEEEVVEEKVDEETTIPVVTSSNNSGSYKIYIHKYNGGVPVGELNKLLTIKGVKSQKFADKSIEFTAGSWNREEAERQLAAIKSQGFSDAYIIGDDQPVQGQTFSTNSSATSAPEVSDNDEIYYTVQIGAYSRSLTASEESKASPVQKETLSNGINRYYSGQFSDFQSALEHSEKMDLVGFKGAFVVGFKNGQKVPLSELGKGAARKSTNSPAQTETVQADLVYKIQLGVFKDDVPFDLLQKFAQIQGVEQEVTKEGITRYTAGKFKNYEEANEFKKLVVNNGVTDCFVVAFYKGSLVTLQEAKALQQGK